MSVNLFGFDCSGTFSILRQSGTQHIEPMVAMQYAMTADVPCLAVALGSLEGYSVALAQGNVLPVGSVEFLRKAMRLACVDEPGNISYPQSLAGYLKRHIELRPAGAVMGHWFIKPTSTKAFTGYVVDTANPDNLNDYDRIQNNVFLSLTPETDVWISEPVVWVSEYRYYVINGQIHGCGRYDDGPDDAPIPNMAVVAEMAAASDDLPIAYSLDVGVLDTGDTALIECNDAWALGFYKGTLSRKDYIKMLLARWQQMFAK